MENNASSIEMLFERAENYTKTSIELAKLNAIDKTADVVSSLISRMAISVVFAMFVFLSNIGLSLWVGKLVGQLYFGFFIVGAFYLALALLLYYFKDKWIKMPISNFIIVKMLKNS
ncbi:hypothetical protein IQ05_01045 [Flavobacterium tiangeerense]|uniref:Superfamily III holin-X n=1 Tax=Flavobacterium tiangeerense TaxID=459471 RepID=A0ABY3FK72_9FLAO|nr:hypothetical protein [Flavobacterium tiangeerense]TWI00399.1 hypothetical protein IQ05_01045 [Flavobacterium tiangeerense]